MYLIDTNVWLERLLDQTRADEVKHFFDRVVSEHLFITDFTFHSMGVVMSRQTLEACLHSRVFPV